MVFENERDHVNLFLKMMGMDATLLIIHCNHGSSKLRFI